MRSSVFLSSVILGLFPSCLEALAIKGHPDNLTFGRFEVVDSANLTKRQDPIAPEECFVSGLGMSSYWYMPVYSGDEVYACVMGHKRATGQNWECPGDEFWPDSYLEEIIAVGKEQMTKDGGGEKSYNGVFQARWEGTTTAVSDQEGMSTLFDAIFRYTMPDCDANPGICTTKSRHYYYKYKGDVSIPLLTDR
jgi:hypothetical protein